MVKGGYSSLMEPVAATLNIQMGVVVSQISYSNQGVKVTSASGELTYDVCLLVGKPIPLSMVVQLPRLIILVLYFVGKDTSFQ